MVTALSMGALLTIFIHPFIGWMDDLFFHFEFLHMMDGFVSFLVIGWMDDSVIFH
jgi:hypothetical protein